MMRYLILLTTLLLAAISGHAQDNGKYDIIPGTYKGTLPCEECKIIESELELKYGTDSTGEFSLRDKYVSRGGTDVMSRMKGEWLVTKDVFEDRKVTMIILNYDNEDKAMYYILKTDGNLLPLDKDKHKIVAETDCTLKRML